MSHLLCRLMVIMFLLFGQVLLAQTEHQSHRFFDQLAALCGSRFVGEMTFPTEGQDSFKGKQLVAEFNQCDKQQLRVHFAVGEDTSRTWVFTKTKKSLSLKHDHRHADGSPDEMTNYGGDSDGFGSSFMQSFPADKFTQELIPAASTNVWSVSISEDQKQLTYHLQRHNKPRFTAVLTRSTRESE